MSDSKAPKVAEELVTLIAEADSPSTEVIVINGQFARVAKGLGRVEVLLPLGIYKVKFKTGPVFKEVLAVLKSGSRSVTVRVESEEMRFASAAPLHKTATSRESHRDAASQISRSRPHLVGRGSRLFLFVRDLIEDVQENVANGLSLVDINGQLVVENLPALGEHSLPNAYTGIHLEIPPGAYRLQVRHGSSEVLEQSVITCPRWQTQVFLLRQPCGAKGAQRLPDLSDASVLMARPEVGFNPEQTEQIATQGGFWKGFGQTLRWAEQARLGLAEGRDVVSDAALDQLLFRKFDSPMLGIYGAHLLLLRLKRQEATKQQENIPIRSTDGWRLLRKVADNLMSLVDGHPDVLALYAALPSSRVRLSTYQFPLPPMLLSSWQAVIDASARYEPIIPSGSLAARVASRIWGSGPWLIWKMPLEQQAGLSVLSEDQQPASFTTLLRAVYRSVMMWLGPHLDTDKLPTITPSDGLNVIEDRLLNYFVQVARLALRTLFPAEPGTPKAEEKARPSTSSFLSTAKLVESIRLPASVLAESLHSLVEKVRVEPLREGESWPPPDGASYIRSETFGQLILDLAIRFMNRYPNMDFTDAVAQVFTWLEGKLHDESDFINSSRFPTRGAFLAYLKQAMWNAARLAQRKRKREESLGVLPLDQPAVARELDPEEASSWTERIEALPSPQREILSKLLFGESSLTEVASAMGSSPDEVASLYEDAISRLASDQPVTRTGKPKKRQRKST